MPYGYLQTGSNVAKQLKELNRDYEGRKTWGQLYGSVDLSSNKAIASLERDYAEDVSEAYASAYRNRGAIQNMGLGQGFVNEATSDLDLALSEAFQAYKQNYANNVSSIKQNANEARSAIDATLLNEAENYVKMQNSTYDYLQYLYDRSQGLNNYELDANLQRMFAENPNWNKYIVQSKDQYGNDVSRLMTQQELYERNYTLNPDGTANITSAGIDFYDQMLNSLTQEVGGYGYYDWLSKQDSDLFNWASERNAYDYTEAGTNLGTFKTMMGIKSTDDQYQFIERFGGLNEEQINKMFSNFTNKVTELYTKLGEANHFDRSDILSDVSKLTAEVRNVAAELGLENEIEEALGMSWENFNTILNYYAQNFVTTGELAADILPDVIGTTISTGTAGAALGSKLGASGGTVIAPGVGTAIGTVSTGMAGAIIGSFAGMLMSIPNAWNKAKTSKAENIKFTQKSIDAYNDLILTLINVASNKAGNQK